MTYIPSHKDKERFVYLLAHPADAKDDDISLLVNFSSGEFFKDVYRYCLRYSYEIQLKLVLYGIHPDIKERITRRLLWIENYITKDNFTILNDVLDRIDRCSYMCTAIMDIRNNYIKLAKELYYDDYVEALHYCEGRMMYNDQWIFINKLRREEGLGDIDSDNLYREK